MSIKAVVARGIIVGALTASALGATVVTASAQPLDHTGFSQDRWDHDWDHDHWRGGPGWHDRWDRAYWRDNPWHYDARPAWGWAPPPPAVWRGPLPDRWGPPPPMYDYNGYRVQPVWDDGFNAWGFRLFGVWIPLAV